MKKIFYAALVVIVLVLAGGLFCSLNTRVEKIDTVSGRVEKYYFMKKLVGERSYRNGVLEGRTATYYPGGTLKSEWTYVNGKRQGLARQYTEAGNLRYEDEYDGDKRISRKEYDDRGNLISPKPK